MFNLLSWTRSAHVIKSRDESCCWPELVKEEVDCKRFTEVKKEAKSVPFLQRWYQRPALSAKAHRLLLH